MSHNYWDSTSIAKKKKKGEEEEENNNNNNNNNNKKKKKSTKVIVHMHAVSKIGQITIDFLKSLSGCS